MVNRVEGAQTSGGDRTAMRMNPKYDHRSRKYWRKNIFFLDAQPSYWKMSDWQHRFICNGVGSTVGWWAKLTYHLIPNTIWFLNITPVSDIHDYDYSYPQRFATKLEATAAKLQADNRFLSNGDRLVEAHGGAEWLKTLRRIRLEKYHLVLRECGEQSFMQGKIIASH